MHNHLITQTKDAFGDPNLECQKAAVSTHLSCYESIAVQFQFSTDKKTKQ